MQHNFARVSSGREKVISVSEHFQREASADRGRQRGGRRYGKRRPGGSGGGGKAERQTFANLKKGTRRRTTSNHGTTVWVEYEGGWSHTIRGGKD